MVAIVLSGDTYSKVNTLFGKLLFLNNIEGFLGMKIGSEKMYYQTVAPNVDKAVQTVTDEFLLQCRLRTVDRHNVRVVIDAGWSHPGWWARECTVLGLDGQTGLPLAVFHVMKDVNFKGSSKGI
jgi:hypothetical protein